MNRLILATLIVLCSAWSAAPAAASMPPPLPAPAASFNSGSLHVDVYGTAGKSALVFIPGLTCGPWVWSREISQFAANHAIYALTLPGFNGQPALSDHLFQTVSADFWKLMETKNIQRPIVVGHSLGGTLGFLLAEQHPDRLRAIVAVDGLPIYPGQEQQTPAQRQEGALRMSSMLSSISSAQQFEAAEKTYSLPYLITAQNDIDAAAALVAKSDPKGVAAWLTEDLTIDLRPSLKDITVPVLEILPYDPNLDGKAPLPFASAAMKQAYYASLLANDTSATLQVIEPSRHFIMYDQPQKLDDALEAFIRAQQ